MDQILYIFTFIASFGVSVNSGDSTLTCARNAGEDWPMVQRELLRLLSGSGQVNVLAGQLARASASDLQEGPKDCLPGRISLRLLLLVTGSPVSAEHAEQLVGADWHAVGILGWPAVIRSGWPIFRLLRLIQNKMERQTDTGESGKDATIPMCSDSEEPFSALLTRHVKQRRMQEGESLLAASVEYLAKDSTLSSDSNNGCPLSTAAAFLTIAWGRFPVHDVETEDVLRLAQPLVSQLNLASVLITQHALLHMLDDMATTYQSFLIDSGALYEDLRPTDNADTQSVDYTRHMMNDRGIRMTGGRVCPWLYLRTPFGYCNPFAYIGSSLSRWRRHGVRLEDVAQALRVSGPRSSANKPVRGSRFQTQGPVVLLRLIGKELVVVDPKRAEGTGYADDVEPAEVACLVQEILSLLGKVELPDFDIVVNVGSRPLLPSNNQHELDEVRFRQQEVNAPPIFSACFSQRFWDIPLPNQCAKVQCESAQARAARSEGRQKKNYVSKPCFDMNNGTRACGKDLDIEPDLVDMLSTATVNQHIHDAEESAEGFSLRCYLFQMLASYGDLLTYEPSHVQTAFFGHPVVRAFKAPRLQRSGSRLLTSDFQTKCREAIDLLAQ